MTRQQDLRVNVIGKLILEHVLDHVNSIHWPKCPPRLAIVVEAGESLLTLSPDALGSLLLS